VHGIVQRITDRRGGFELINEPRLGENFRILLPLPDYRCNYILGTQQKLASHEKTANGVKLSWKGPLKNEKGEFDLDVALWVELVDEAVTFYCEVRNGTEHQLAEVWYAFVGGMRGLGKTPEERRATEFLLPH